LHFHPIPGVLNHHEQTGKLPILGFQPYDPQVIEADLTSQAVYDIAPETVAAARGIWEKLRGI
jgi:hypothetical protein